jgi:hypothetical protein
MMPLVTSIERRLQTCSGFLTYGGKLEMINSVLSSLPTFYMCTLKIYRGIIEQLDKYRRHCLSRGEDLSKQNPPLAAWPMVCKPKEMGGLMVVNLQIQNECLLMKHLDKFYNQTDIPWVRLITKKYYSLALPPAKRADCSFWWRDCLKLLPKYKNLAICTLHNGSTTLLWKDS